MAYTIGYIAKRAGVTVRLLHHYDAMGLVRASDRSRAGYRLYSDNDLARLQEVLFYRELGVSLEQIAELLKREHRSRTESLQEHRGELVKRRDRLSALIQLVDETLVAIKKGHTMSPKEMFEPFASFDPKKHEAEAELRWGSTENHRTSKERTKNYSPEQWNEYKRASAANVQAFVAARDQGLPPESERAMQAAEEHRGLIDTWFYPCSYAMHRQLGAMYLADERFGSHYEAFSKGITNYLVAAIEANARRAGVDG